ncbi:MAG: acyl-CoA dehydrogenase family protein, partial [Actinomycetota bacterium]|nr:acyl-CoA dehydrogenase family protein [Actinomycetota bacterium]
CEVVFPDVEVPADALLGDLHGGWAVAMAVLIDERGGAGGAGVISLRRRLAAMADGAGELDALGRQHMASVLSRGRALQALMELKGADPQTANVSKLFNSDLGYDEAALSAQLRGPQAMLEGDETERFLYSPGMRIAGGSSEIQRNIIGERTLGLPR